MWLTLLFFYGTNRWRVTQWNLKSCKTINLPRKMFFCLVTSMGQWNNSESPWEIELQTLGFALWCSTMEQGDSTVSEVYYEVKWHTSCILLGSAMSIVKWNVFLDRNSRDGKFWAQQRIKKDVFSSCHKRGTKKKFWVSMRGRF